MLRSRREFLRDAGLVTAAACLPLDLGRGVAAAAQPGGFTFTLVHTNDIHAHLTGFQPGGIECVADRPCFGGLAQHKALFDRIRATTPNVLLLDAGDVFQGTLFYNEYKGMESVPLMNAAGYQAMAIGNHEFDDGPANLARFIRAVNFPVLSANIDASAEPALAGLIKPWTIVNVGGKRIGIFGLTTVDTPSIASPGPNLKFVNEVEAARRSVDELRAQGVDIVIGLTHIGYGVDKRLAEQVDGISVIVGGHSHSPLGTTDPAPAGPYPTVVRSPGGRDTLVVQAYQWGHVVGRLDLTFDERGNLVAWQGEPILIDRSVPEDAAAKAEITRLQQPLEARLRQVIGQSTGEFGQADCRVSECAMGSLIADALIALTRNAQTQVAIFNGGGIRAGLPAGPITMGDVLKAFPFSNTIATFELRGSDLRAAIEHGLSRVGAESGTGRFPQVGGLRYSYDPARPPGQRLLSIEVGTPATGFRPLDGSAIYHVVSNDFMRKGGDEYVVLRDKAINPYDNGALLSDALADYIRVNSPISPRLDGRIRLAGMPAVVTQPAAGAPAPAAQPAGPAPATQMPRALPRSGSPAPAVEWPWLATAAAALAVAGLRARGARGG